MYVRTAAAAVHEEGDVLLTEESQCVGPAAYPHDENHHCLSQCSLVSHCTDLFTYFTSQTYPSLHTYLVNGSRFG